MRCIAVVDKVIHGLMVVHGCDPGPNDGPRSDFLRLRPKLNVARNIVVSKVSEASDVSDASDDSGVELSKEHKGGTRQPAGDLLPFTAHSCYVFKILDV